MSRCAATDLRGRQCIASLENHSAGLTIHLVVIQNPEEADEVDGFIYLWPTPRPAEQLELEDS